MKRLAVIIPGYRNPDAWWHRCVASVLKAIGPEDEIICVDDGSPVNPKLDEIAKTDARVRVIYRAQNGGLSAARNTALDEIDSRYVAFVDSDDEVMPDVYERTIEKMKATGSAVGLFGVKVIWVKERLTKSDIPEDRAYGALKPEDVNDLSKKCLLNYAWNKVYDVKAIAEKLTNWDLRFDEGGMPCEDIIFNLQVIMTGASWCSAAVPGYIYYRTEGTLLSNYKPTNGTGERCAAEAWRCYCEVHPEALKLFEPRTKWTDFQQSQSDWANIWRSRSPYGLVGRWRWLNEHRALGGAKLFVMTLLKNIFRRYFYCVALRRRHTRNLFPNVEEMV